VRRQGSCWRSVRYIRSEQLALALLRSTAINKNSIPRSTVTSATITSPCGNIKLLGDIMALVPSQSFSDDPAWVWNGCFITLPSNGSDSGMNSHIASIAVPRHLTKIVNPQVTDATVHLDRNDQQLVNSNNMTWLLSNAALELIILSLWKKIADLKVALSTIPGLSTMLSSFPNQNGNGTTSKCFISEVTMQCSSLFYRLTHMSRRLRTAHHNTWQSPS
jgi:hypothetical protein